jgi:hypothetical protein
MANAFGRAHLRSDTATYFRKALNDEHECKLKSGFAPKATIIVIVSRPENDRFFGGNFTSDCTCQRTSRTIPQYTIDGIGDTLCFARLPPDALKDNP